MACWLVGRELFCPHRKPTKRWSMHGSLRRFNKRFAVVADDIKSQLSFVLANAAKHRVNVDFQNDAFETVRQPIDKLNKMLWQLRAERPRTEPAKSVELAALLRDIVARHCGDNLCQHGECQLRHENSK